APTPTGATTSLAARRTRIATRRCASRTRSYEPREGEACERHLGGVAARARHLDEGVRRRGHLDRGLDARVRRPLHTVQVPGADPAGGVAPARAAEPARAVPDGGASGQPRSGAPRPRPGGWTQRPALTHRSRPRAATPRREAARPQRRLRGDPASDSRSARAVEGTVRPTGRYPGGTSRCEEPGGQIMTTNPSPFAVVVESAGVSDPSSTKLLAQQTA